MCVQLLFGRELQDFSALNLFVKSAGRARCTRSRRMVANVAAADILCLSKCQLPLLWSVTQN